jgi:hypothetical protein
MNLAFKISLFIIQSDFLHATKSYDGADGFSSPLNEDVLWIFIALKNLSTLPGLNRRILCPMASTLTITPMRRLSNNLVLLSYIVL